MKRVLLLSVLLLLAGKVFTQQLVPGPRDVVHLDEYPLEAYLVESDANTFYRISGAYSTNTDHPLLSQAVSTDFRSLYFIKYDSDGIPQKANFIRGTYSPRYAASFKGGLTVMTQAYDEVDASGQVIPIPATSMVELVASYDPDCQLVRIINIWALTANQYTNSDAIMDKQDGSIYVYGTASQPLELRGFGTLGKDLDTPNSFFYVIKYNSNLDFQWVYQVGFDPLLSGTSPYFDRIQVFPGNNGEVLVTGTYGGESSPVINGTPMTPYLNSDGTFAVLLDAGAQERWVLEGLLNSFDYASRIFKGFPMPDGGFVLAGNTYTGYYKLGEAEFNFANNGTNNQFVFRINPSGGIMWARPFESQGPLQEGKKKSTASEVFNNRVYYDAINWKNRLLYLTAPFQNPAFTVAGTNLNLTYPMGIYVAALDLWDGSQIWGYAVSSNDATIYGFDSDRSGNLSLMGYNYLSQHLDGIPEAAVVPGSFIFNVGLDYKGNPLWYVNLSLPSPPYYDLDGTDLEVLPNGEVFTSLKMGRATDIIVGESVVSDLSSPQSSWLLKLAPDMLVGGKVTDANENPVSLGYVKAIKSAWWGIYPEVDSAMLDAGGNYLFENLYPGNYTLLAIADKAQYPHAIPTYYGDQTGWKTVSFNDFYPKFNANVFNIRLGEAVPPGPGDGAGQMSGTISYENESTGVLKGTAARPAPKSAVILLKKSKKSTMASEVVAYVETDEYGMYSFTNVPDGDYLLHVEVPGLDMLEIHEVTIVGEQIVSGLNYTIGEDGIYIGWPAGVSLLENETINIYPNPGTGLILVDFPEAGDYEMKIYGTDGSLVMKEQFHSAGGARSIDMTGENDGIYFIKIMGPGTDATVKYIKN
jgi:hypothetical protein